MSTKPKKKDKSKIAFQQSLDKWFVRKDAEGNLIESTYKIFYLDWPQRTATWLSAMPIEDQITYQTTIKWSDLGHDQVHLVGYIPNPIPVGNKMMADGFYTNTSFLKSHLQKAIRRSQTSIALKTANHFIRLDLNDFLRRLAIIMLEDVHLMSSFPVLVWLMAANSKGYDPDLSLIYWLFGLVYNLAQAEWKDSPEFNKYEPLSKQRAEWKSWPLSKLDAQQKTLIYSLQFRKAFGGLSGDRKMIDVLAQMWRDRFLHHNTKNNEDWLERLVKYEVQFLSPPEEGLELNQWILPAIDFHVMSNMISILADKYEEFSYDDIKSSIWHCSSKYNNKHYNHYEPTRMNEYKIIWEKIRAQFYSLAEYFLVMRRAL